MTTTIFSRMKQLRDTAESWNSADPVLLEGEIGVELDTDSIKVGDGVSRWSQLPYITGGGGGEGAVQSVFGREGNVVALTGDYTAAQVLAEIGDVSTVQAELDIRGKLQADNIWELTQTFNDSIRVGTVTVDVDNQRDLGSLTAKHREIFADTFNEGTQRLEDKYVQIALSTLTAGEGLYSVGNLATGLKFATDLAPLRGLGYDGEGDFRQLRVDLSQLSARSNALVEDGLVLRSASDNQVYAITLGDMLGNYTGPLKLRGVWDADTNTVTGDELNLSLGKGVAPIAPGGGDPEGYTYICHVEGSFDLTDLPGPENWKLNDKAVWTGSAWVLVPAPPNEVFSVFTRKGDVVAETGDYLATQIPVDQNAGITAINTQGALEDLSTDKADKTILINAGSGLFGGGDLSEDRTLEVGAGTGINVSGSAVSLDVEYADGRYANLGLLNTFTAANVFNNTSTFNGNAAFVGSITVPNSAVSNHALNTGTADQRYPPNTRTLTAGNGLTGGGDLSANRTFTVGQGTGINVTSTAVQLDVNYTDGRYGRTAAPNTWSAENTFNGNAVFVGNTTFAGATNTFERNINVPTPQLEAHAASKGYVDDFYARVSTQNPVSIFNSTPPTSTGQQISIQTSLPNRLVFVNFAINRHGGNTNAHPQCWWLGSTSYSPNGEQYANMSQGRQDSSSRRHLPSGQIAVRTDASGFIRLKCLLYTGSTSEQGNLVLSIETYI